ncbi:hypothetical protein Cni_G06078 [Canna indica]|uniref:Uncharacterized protein n=1 Tax=Canna indica TaxID=4628 RepID=A0AAQ3K0R3_9LILI|nr:hypothetical protein Cni_G06078 [Canna indica]
MEYLDGNILPQIAAVVGRPLKIDNHTQSGDRGKFARVCVMLNIKKPLQQGFWIDSDSSSFFQSVAYENLLLICFSCAFEEDMHKAENNRSLYSEASMRNETKRIWRVVRKDNDFRKEGEDDMIIDKKKEKDEINSDHGAEIKGYSNGSGGLFSSEKLNYERSSKVENEIRKECEYKDMETSEGFVFAAD